jgi:hypothetical protein
MIMSGLELLTLVHVIISLVGIASGFIIVYGLITAKRYETMTKVFLATNIATSVTGYFFPFVKLLPSHIVGVLALIVLTLAVIARYRKQLAGRWRIVYIVSSVVALYFNVFVLVVQIFGKITAFKELAPTQSEPPFLIAQTLVLLVFVVLGIMSTMRFRGETVRPA